MQHKQHKKKIKTVTILFFYFLFFFGGGEEVDFNFSRIYSVKLIQLLFNFLYYTCSEVCHPHNSIHTVLELGLYFSLHRQAL